MKKAKVSKYGQWKYPGEDTIIPNANGRITMKGVPYPVLGIDDMGNQQMMMPNMDYQFPGNSVYEIPMMASGGLVNPCPPGQVPDGQGGCIDDLSTPPIPSSSLYNYYMENLNKFKAQGLNNAEEIVRKMVKSRRTCKPGDECWEEPEIVKPSVVNDPNIQKVIFNTDKGDIYKVQDRKTKRLIRYEDFNGNVIDINNPNGTPANEFYDRGPNAQPGLMPGKEMKRIAIPSGGFKQGGDISIPNLRSIKIKSLPKAQSKSIIKKELSSSGLTPEQQQNYEDQYLVYRAQGDFPRVANDLAFNDATYFGSGPIYNFQPFLPNPDSGVRVASGKRFPYEHIDPKTFDPWEENYMSDPEYVARYNKMTPDQQEMAQNRVRNYEGLDTYNYNLDNVKRWEKNWYSQRAKLPQFTDIANKRLSLVENINMQPYGNNREYENVLPGSGGVYRSHENVIAIPSFSFSYPSTLAHERSHWYDWNAPQNNDMYNGSYLRSYLNPGTIPNPVYNDEDAILNNILPSEYTMPHGTAQPLRSGENDTNTYDTETEKIIANLPTASDKINNKTVKIPFKGQESMFGNTRGNIEYYTKPTEVRARLNEWRLEHNIDPTKDYSNEELQQIIDKDIENKNSNNFDLYKVIQGRGDLLKKIHDSYVSTGGKENPDEMPRAQTTGNVKKGKTLFGRPYQVVETEAGPTVSGRERPGETTRVKTVYYKNGNVAKQIIDNNEVGGNETTWHDKDGKVTAVENDMGYRTFSNGYFDYTNNSDYEASKRRQDESEWFDYGNKLDAFIKRAKLNLENISKDGSQPGDSYNTIWSDWENNKSDYTRTKNPGVRKSRGKFEYGGIPRAQAIGIKKPNFNQTLNIPLQFQQAPNFMDVHVAMPQNSGFGDFTTHRVPTIYDAAKSGNPSSMEEAINKYLGYPMDKAYDAADRLAPEGEDPIDSFRHPAAAMYTQQAIKDKVGVPILGDALGFLGANASGIGHEVSTLFKDERPWDIKLREAGEDAVNNFAGSVVGLLPGTQDEKANLIYNMSLSNWLPDGVVSKDPNKNMYLKDEQGNVHRDTPMEFLNKSYSKKQGGTIRQVKIKSLPKAQDGFLGDLAKQFNITPAPTQGIFDQVNQVINTPKQKQVTPSVIQQAQEVINKEVPQQTTPDVFEQIDKFSEDVRNIKPTSGGSSESMYNRFTKMLEAAQPEPEAPKEFTIPEDYYTRLMQEENGVNRGLRDDRYYQYPSHEKGTDTIGYGHKLTEEEQKSGRYKDGLTKDEAIALMRNDVQEHLGRTIEQYNEKFGNGAFDKLHPDLKVLALDYVYNGIPINEFPNFFGAANKYSSTQDANAKQAALDEMLKQYVRHDDKGVPLGSRNEYTKGVLMNLKQRGGLAKAQQVGQFGNWRDILNYKNAAEPKQNLVGDVRKTARPTAVAESTKVPTQKLPANYKELQQQKIAQDAYDALPEELKRRDTLTADTRSDAEKFARRAWTAVSQPMETIAALNKGYDIPSGYLGMHNAYEGYDVGSPMTSVVDMAAGVPGFIGNAAYRQGEQIVNNPFEYALTNTLGLFDPKSRGQAISNYLDLSAVIPVAHAASPLLRNASRSTAGFTKPSLLTNITDANAASYEDDLFRYIADAEGGAGIDREYLMALPEEQYRMYGELSGALRTPGFNPNQNEIRRFLEMDSRLNNRIMPPPDEVVFDSQGFTDVYSNPFATEGIIDLRRPSSIRDRLFGRLSRNSDIPFSRMRSSSKPQGQSLPTNRSYLTKDETKAIVKDKSELDKLEKLNDREFRDVLITPDGKIKFPEKYKGPKQIVPVETEEWVNEFNDNLDLLNNIIAKNNTSGREYWVTGITKDGILKFRTADGIPSSMYTGITPGKFRGDVADVASMDYMANDIPGLRMESAQPIFGQAVRGTGTYKSLNEYLKKLDLGRIKSGMNSQTEFSRGLWENAIKKGDAFGFYGGPRTVYGIMKKDGGAKKKKAGFQVLTDANGKYVFVKT